MNPDITAALIALLKTSTDVTDIAGQRIVSDQLPQSFPTPAIVLWANSELAFDAIDGPLGMDQPTFRVHCYAKSRVDSAKLRLIVRDFIGGFSGLITLSDGDVFIKGIAQRTGQTQFTQRVRSGTDQYRFVASQDYRVTYDSDILYPTPTP